MRATVTRWGLVVLLVLAALVPAMALASPPIVRRASAAVKTPTPDPSCAGADGWWTTTAANVRVVNDWLRQAVMAAPLLNQPVVDDQTSQTLSDGVTAVDQAIQRQRSTKAPSAAANVGAAAAVLAWMQDWENALFWESIAISSDPGSFDRESATAIVQTSLENPQQSVSAMDAALAAFAAVCHPKLLPTHHAA